MARSKVIGVYMIEHSATGRRYVGKAVDVLKRVAAHLNGTSRDCRYLNAAIRKHGREAFVWSLLERCETESEATERERFWIRELNTVVPHGMNLTLGGDGVSGLRWTNEARARKSAAHRGKSHAACTRAKMSASKRAFYATEEGAAVVARRADRVRGIKRSDATRAKMAAAQRARRASERVAHGH